MSRDNVSALRAEVARLRKATTRKVSRLKQTHDVYVSGTKYDPRRPTVLHKRYTAPQLKKYITEMNAFLSRANQFVPDSQRRPMPREEWRQYKVLEQKYNQSVDAYFERVADLQLTKSETIRQSMAAMVPDHRQTANMAVNSPYKPPTREPTNVAGRAALAKLTADMKDRLHPDHFARHNKEGMKQFDAMARTINEPGLADAVKGLTDEQFAVLWNYTSFSTAISLNYEIMLKILSDEEKPWHSGVQNSAVKQAYGLIEWAKTLKIGL